MPSVSRKGPERKRQETAGGERQAHRRRNGASGGGAAVDARTAWHFTRGEKRSRGTLERDLIIKKAQGGQSKAGRGNGFRPKVNRAPGGEIGNAGEKLGGEGDRRLDLKIWVGAGKNLGGSLQGLVPYTTIGKGRSQRGGGGAYI